MESWKSSVLFRTLCVSALLCCSLLAGSSLLAQPSSSGRLSAISGSPGHPGDVDPSLVRAAARLTKEPKPFTPHALKPLERPLAVQTIIPVTSSSDTGAGTLRKAIDSANASPGLDEIVFNISGSGVQTITPLSPLPDITGPLIIDGTSQPGYSGEPLIEINGSLAGNPAAGFFLSTGGGCTIRGLVIDHFSGVGIVIATGNPGGNVIQGNYIGVDPTGTAVAANAGNGIFTDAANDTIGGLAPGAGNIISGNSLPGIYIASHGNGTVIQGNNIGTDLSGSVDLGNLQNGINIEGGAHTLIGDTTEAGRNIISGNDFPGVYIIGPTATGNRVIGNYIGTDVAGFDSLGDGNGVVIDNAPNNIVGGPETGARNLISGLPFPGVFIKNAGATGNRIVNNFIGTDGSGRFSLGNTKGIVIDNASGNTIGGDNVDEGNLISGNSLMGIEVRNAGATGNKILNNFIGTDLGGTRGVPNGTDGIVISSGQDTVRFNTIAFNRGAGVYDSAGTRTLITDNSMFSNSGLGIDLAPRGLTINDSLDGDTGPNDHQNFPILDSAHLDENGAFVVGHLASKPNMTYQIDFYTNDAVNNSHFGEGRSASASIQVNTDPGGNARFTASVPVIVGGDKFITATATDSGGNTSEFSQALDLRDTDGDGIPDSWETQGWGIDVNSDGVIDLDLYARGARPNHKDVFVEVDAMTGMAPQAGTLDPVVDAFKTFAGKFVTNGDGSTGINLHCTPLDETDIPMNPWPTRWWEQFDSLKRFHFGTMAERSDSNARFILEAKSLVYRYCIFAYTHDTSTSSGLAENKNGLGGNDFMVTLGEGFKVPGGSEDDKAGTFMHELGHTLGLRHGGSDDNLYKPNYISIMNYSWQFKYKWGSNFWTLNYSPEALPPLSEDTLDEVIGINPKVGTSFPQIAVPYSSPDGKKHMTRLAVDTVDWNGNGTIDSFQTVSGDVNTFDADEPLSPHEVLTSQTDWDKLVYNFRNSPKFDPAPGNQPRFAEADTSDEPEITGKIYRELDAIPPPKPSGTFLMDGALDTSAALLASNAGLNLYARVKGNQLYVAGDLSAYPNADGYVFVSDRLNPAKAAPDGKSGTVGGWSAFLRLKRSDHTTGWFDGSDSTLWNITRDTVGSVLEGVVDIGYLFGKIPTDLYVALGVYDSASGGSLVAQAPTGGGDGNLDSWEYQKIGGPQNPSGSKYIQQGAKLIGNGWVNTNTGVEQGVSVGLTADGKTLIVGGESDNAYHGAAWLFTRSGSVWQQIPGKLLGTGYTGQPRQGGGVAISADGTTAAVGGYSDNNFVGACWIFTRPGGIWTQQGSKLVPNDYVGNPWAANSVALSADGNTLIMGGAHDNNNIGAAWVFTRSGGVWTQQGPKLVGTGYVKTDPYAVVQGYSVALSADGNTAMIGGPGDDSGKGAAWVFKRSGSVWSQSGPKIVIDDSTNTEWLASAGLSVSLSADGHRAIMGAFRVNNEKGNAYVLSDSAGAWTLEATLHGTGATEPVFGAAQGYTVALSADGNTALVGGIQDNVLQPPDSLGAMGATWAFKREGGSWSQVGPKIVGAGAQPYPGGWDLQGYALAASADGSTIAIGAPNDASFPGRTIGATWIFAIPRPDPFVLTGLGATGVTGGHVKLDWSTSSETNDSGFVVQKRPVSDSVYADILGSFIAGHGTTYTPYSYSFIDSFTTAGKWYYRLKQLDFSGAESFSPPVVIDIATGVGTEKALPKTFALYQSYPNPFNPTTTIRYDLPKAAHVSLRVYNILGQLVNTLKDEEQMPGTYEVRFNAANALASGVYFYRIEAGSFVQTKKILLLR